MALIKFLPIREFRVYLWLKLGYDGRRLLQIDLDIPMRLQSIKDALPHKFRI